MTGEELYDLFVSGHATVADIAAMDGTVMKRHIGDLRLGEPDLLDMTDDEIAEAIQEFARDDERLDRVGKAIEAPEDFAKELAADDAAS